MTASGATAPGPLPAYDGIRPYPPKPLSFEHSAHVRVDPADSMQYIKELAKADNQLERAWNKLDRIKDEKLPTKWVDGKLVGDPEARSLRVRDGIEGARRLLFPYMQHDAKAADFLSNEVPRFHADGTVFADDVARGIGDTVEHALVATPGANTRFETVLYRLPKMQVEVTNHQAIADALEGVEKASIALSYRDSAEKIPDLGEAMSRIKDARGKVQLALEGATTTPPSGGGVGGIVDKVRSLPLGGKLAIGGAALLVAGSGAYMAARD